MDDFIYFGHFYRLCIDGVVYCCRSTLEIVHSCNLGCCARAVAENPGALLEYPPNAIFVMLNPGSSRPYDSQEPGNIIDPSEIHEDARCHLVATYPDDTQRAIENVMLCKQFGHVRVINLFDIRHPDSRWLVKKVRESLGLVRGKHLPRDPEMKPYSIFSCERRCELGNRLNAQRHVVVAAWTTKDGLRPFFEKCYRILCDQQLQVHGWQSGKREERRYRHPSRLKKKWPRRIVRCWPN